MKEWFKRRVLKRIKQRHPIEVWVGGKCVIAGSGKIVVTNTKPFTITIDHPFEF